MPSGARTRPPPSGGAGPSAPSPRVVIPSHTHDPVSSLQPWPVELELAGKVYTFPALPAVDWLSVLMADPVDPDRILLDLCPGGHEPLFDEDLDQELLGTALLDVIEQVAGRKWWIALRLIGVVRANWNVLGAEMFYRHINPATLSLSAWLDVMLVITIRAMDPKDVAMFTSRLEIPPAGEETALEDMEMSTDQFLSMAG